MQNARQDEAQAGLKIPGRNISNFRYADDTTLMAERGTAAAKSLQSCPTLCDPMNCSMPGLPAHHQLLEFRLHHVKCQAG